MKANFKIISMCLMILGLASCSDKDMLTVINADGSCYREFTAQVDSAFMTGSIEENNPFPVSIDSTWQIAWKYAGSADVHTNFPLNASDYAWTVQDGELVVKQKFEVLVRKNYSSVNEMAEQFKFKISHPWNDMEVNYALDKKFRWFYTYYVYDEIYPKIEHNFSPIDKYMTEEESQFWFTGQPDLLKGMNGFEIAEYTTELEGKYEKWLAQNYWEAMYRVFVDHYDELGLTIPKNRFEALRDSIFQIGSLEDIDTDNVVAKMDNYFATDKFSQFNKDDNQLLKNFDNDFWAQDFIKYFDGSFTYKLIMPGKVLKAENAVQQNDTLVWRLTAFRMVADDYTIEAVSRKTNSWAFAVTGLIVLIAIGGFAYRRKN